MSKTNHSLFIEQPSIQLTNSDSLGQDSLGKRDAVMRGDWIRRFLRLLNWDRVSADTSPSRPDFQDSLLLSRDRQSTSWSAKDLLLPSNIVLPGIYSFQFPLLHTSILDSGKIVLSLRSSSFRQTFSCR